METFGYALKQAPGLGLQHILPAASITKGLQDVWEVLAGEGGREEALVAAMEAAGEADELARLFFLLERIEQEGLLCWWVEESGRRFITLEPMTPKFRFSSPHLSDHTFIQLSRFACLRREASSLIIETGLSPARIICHDWRGVAVAACLASPKTVPELVAEFDGAMSAIGVRRTVALLAAAGVLAGGEEEDEALRQWEFHDLLFHTSSRRGRHDRRCGGTLRFLGKIDPLPAVKEVSGAVIQLPEITAGQGGDFFDVLHRRRSVREQGEEPLTLQQLADFLGHTARICGTLDPDAHNSRLYQIAFRPYPSGGGCSELEIYPAVNACAGLQRGLYRYDGTEHRLDIIAAPTEGFERLLQEAGNTYGGTPQVLLIIAARFQRVSWKYESIAYSLILKDVGCLQQTMYLVATALGLAPCALGVGDAELFAEVAGLDYFREGAVGEFVLGTRRGAGS